ncbi:MAG: hypothetical protein K2X87_28710, partial [Gemmataceae bacterium]|nr:hypothetical protein [Gemmataceae bacterium]
MHRPGLLCLALAVSLTAGCAKPPVSQSGPGKGQAGGPAADPWEAVARRFKKETDPAAVKTALGQLGNDLAARPELPQLPGLPPDRRDELVKLVPLSEAEVAEVTPAVYSGLDAAYVADAFYLLDAARSLDPGGLPPAELARLGFDWVCRQVYPYPWENESNIFVPAVPPTAVLRRGSGTGLERAYVFLALLQQMGLDGCLVGPPEAAGQPAGPRGYRLRAADGSAGLTVPRGPFWAVGVRAGSDVLLFDPWAGRPVPGPGGAGVATLAQAKADPNLLKDAAGGPTPDQVKGAAVFLAAPVSGLSPRMAVLEEKLKAEVGVRLATDPATLRARFADAAGGPPRFWHPADDTFAYGRVMAAFTPVEEGGTDPSPPRVRLRDQYLRSMLPPSVMALPAGLEAPPAMDRLSMAVRGAYAVAFLSPPGGQPGPRERIQRGQFQDANRFLTEKQDAFGRGLERLREADRGEAGKWVETVNELYAALRRARFPDPLKDREPRPDTDPAVADARRALDEFWQATTPVVIQMVDRAVAAPGQAEAAYLLALSKHEEAERKHARAARAGSDDARAAARAAWAEAA